MTGSALEILDCLDSDALATARRRELSLPRQLAAELGHSAVQVALDGHYLTETGDRVAIGSLIERACAAKTSIPPGASLPSREPTPDRVTRVQVTNETTLQAGRRLVDRGFRPLALNFANGVSPGGGFLHGALAQEEVLCRSSALFPTLDRDPMYAQHRRRPRADSTAWAILSPDVPVFRNDDGTALDRPWLLSFLTCAAPVASEIGQPESARLLRERIHRVLAIGAAFGFNHLVLGAWGCGAFRNDPDRTAADFREALEGPFAGSFDEVVFAIADWSAERRFLGPFRDALNRP